MDFINVAVFFDDFLRLDEHDRLIRFDERRLLGDLCFANRDHGVIVFLCGCGREMLDEREIGEHDLLDDIGELWVDEVVAEQRDAGTDEGDELRSDVWDGDHESREEIGDEEFVREGLDEFEADVFNAVLFNVRRMEEDDSEYVEELDLHDEVFVGDAVAEDGQEGFHEVFAERQRERRVLEMRNE